MSGSDTAKEETESPVDVDVDDSPGEDRPYYEDEPMSNTADADADADPGVAPGVAAAAAALEGLDGGAGGGGVKDGGPTRFETYDAWRIDFKALLDEIEDAGDFAHFRAFESLPNPGLQFVAAAAAGDLDEHAVVPLPLVSPFVEAIKRVGKPVSAAPGTVTADGRPRSSAGRGNDHSHSHCNTWELEPEQVRFTNPVWGDFLLKVAKDATRMLGMRHARPTLRKLVLREPGPVVAVVRPRPRPHEAEEESGSTTAAAAAAVAVPEKVGTLLVCLPARHTGGDVNLLLSGMRQTFATGGATSAFSMSAVAWYEDVGREDEPLASGCRLELSYDIVPAAGAPPQSGLVLQKQSERLRRFLAEWQAQYAEFSPLAYPLEHQYAEAKLAIRHMVERDRAVCRFLHDVCARSGVYLFLATMTGAEETSKNRHDTGPLAVTLEALHTCNGERVFPVPIDIDEDEILAPEDFYDREPDSESWDGMFDDDEDGDGDVDDRSESDDYDPDDEEIRLRYHDSVAVLIPKAKFHRYLPDSSTAMMTRDGRRISDIEERNVVDAMAAYVGNDLERHLDDPVTSASALDFFYQALAARRFPGDVTTCIAVRWALELQDDGLYRAAIAACARNAGNGAYRNSMAVIAKYLNEHYTDDDVGTVAWDKWFGDGLDEIKSIRTVHPWLGALAPLLHSPALQKSFKRWRIQVQAQKLEAEPELTDSHHHVIVRQIEYHFDDPEWIIDSLIPALASRGSRELLCRTLGAVFIRRDNAAFPAARDVFCQLLHLSVAKLAVRLLDLFKAVESRPPAAPEYAQLEFVALVSQCLQIGSGTPAALEDLEQLLQATHDKLAQMRDSPPMPEYWTNYAAPGEFLKLAERLVAKFQKYQPQQPSSSPALKSLLELLIRDGFLHNEPPPLPPSPDCGWTFTPRFCARCTANAHSSRPPCADCATINAFLASPEQQSARLPLLAQRYGQTYPPDADHLPRDLFRCEVDTAAKPPVLVVTKVAPEREVEARKVAVRRGVLRRQLEKLRGEFVRGVLGEGGYAELVLLVDGGGDGGRDGDVSGGGAGGGGAGE